MYTVQKQKYKKQMDIGKKSIPLLNTNKWKHAMILLSKDENLQ